MTKAGDTDSDSQIRQVRVFLQALCPTGRNLLLPLLESAGQATAPGTPKLHFDLEYPNRRDRDEVIYSDQSPVSSAEEYDLESQDGAGVDPFPNGARWAPSREELDQVEYVDAEATPETSVEEWAWYEHKWATRRLAGQAEAERCFDAAGRLALAILDLPPSANRVAQRIRRLGLLGPHEGWVDLYDLLSGLDWPESVRSGLGQLAGAGLLLTLVDDDPTNNCYAIGNSGGAQEYP
jgi:hypothetical protein